MPLSFEYRTSKPTGGRCSAETCSTPRICRLEKIWVKCISEQQPRLVRKSRASGTTSPDQFMPILSFSGAHKKPGNCAPWLAICRSLRLSLPTHQSRCGCVSPPDFFCALEWLTDDTLQDILCTYGEKSTILYEIFYAP